MSRIFVIAFFISSLTLQLLSCSSGDSKAHAKPHPVPDEPKKFGAIQLSYVDSTDPKFKLIRSRLDSFYRKQIPLGFNGSVLIGYKGQVLYERYYGYANKEMNNSLRRSSAVQLASISKTFTGTAVMFLHQHKYLDINDPVSEYLPGFPYSGITVKMLLTHRSGLPDYTHWTNTYRKDARTPMYNDEMLALMIKFKPKQEFRENTRFKYSNTNYALLASIVEKVTEMRFKDFMRKYIFEPLGMNNTFVFDPADGLPESATISYKRTWAREPVMYADGVYGDKGIYSTVTDMYKWDQSFYNKTLLTEETQAMCYTPYSHEKPGIKKYGLGWRMLNYEDGTNIIYHNGWWHGNNTSFYRFVQDNFTIIVLGNKYCSAIYKQAPVIYSILNGGNDTSGTFGEGEE